MVSIVVKTFGVCDFSRLAVYGLALAALALVVFGAYDSYPNFFYSYLLKHSKYR